MDNGTLGQDPGAQDDSEWWLTLSGLPSIGITSVLVTSYDQSITEITSDPVKIEGPPLIGITTPFNRPLTTPCMVMKNRGFDYDSSVDNFTLSTPGYTTTTGFNWHYVGAGSAFSTDEDPTTDETFTDYTSRTMDFTATKTITFPDTWTTHIEQIIYTAGDNIQLEVIPPVITAFPRYYGVPVPGSGGGFDWSGPPVIDGIVSEAVIDNTGAMIEDKDVNWNQAYKYTYHGGGSAPEVVFQCVRQTHAYNSFADEDFFLLSFEVHNDNSLNDGDTIVLGFRLDPAAANPHLSDRLIFIQPFSSGGISGGTTVTTTLGNDVYNADPEQIRVCENSDNWTEITAGSLPNITAKVRAYPTGTSGPDTIYTWSVELKIPRTVVAAVNDWEDIPDDFLFYYNVIRTDSENSISTQAVWPREASIINGGKLISYPFPVTEWGQAYQGDDPNIIYKGVYLTSNSIQTTNANTHQIEVPVTPGAETNTFQVNVYNSTEKEDPATNLLTYLPVNGIIARFYIANWGLPAEASWREIGSSMNNLQAANSVTGDPSDTLYTVDWTLTNDGTDLTESLNNDVVNEYLDSGNRHQCIYVELFSDNVDTKFVQKSAYRNMNFNTASEFKQKAEVSAEGYGPPPLGRSTHKFLIKVITREWQIRNKRDRFPDYLKPYLKNIIIRKTNKRVFTAAAPVMGDENESGGNQTETTTSYIDWTAHGYLYLGPGLVINGKSYDVVKDIGSYTHIVEHEGEVLEWEQEIEDAEEVAEDLYSLDIIQDGVKNIITRIKPVEFSGFSASIHAGASLPIGNLANDYTLGFNVIADVSYRITPEISIIAMMGYNYFPAVNSGDDGTSIINITLNGRYTIALGGDFNAYAGAGPDIYVQDFTTLLYGFNVGAGVDYVISPRIVLEAGVDYHSTFDMQTMFIQGHIGAFIRF